MTLTHAPDAPLDAVEWRVDGKPAERGSGFVSRFVPYLDAAAVARLLDDWVGPDGWSDRYEGGTIDGTYVLWCHLSIRVEDGWVTKSDVGRPSNFEGQKGAVSDAFKRAACLKWGCGRNVYELPTLWAPCRTWTSNGKVQAAPNDQTLPSLRDQLKRAGYSGEGGRVQQSPPEGVDVDTGEVERPLLSQERVDKFIVACAASGVDYEQVVETATNGRTLNPQQVYEDEAPALKAALASIAGDDSPAGGQPVGATP